MQLANCRQLQCFDLSGLFSAVCSVLTYQVSLVQLVTDKKPTAFNKAELKSPHLRDLFKSLKKPDRSKQFPA